MATSTIEERLSKLEKKVARLMDEKTEFRRRRMDHLIPPRSALTQNDSPSNGLLYQQERNKLMEPSEDNSCMASTVRSLHTCFMCGKNRVELDSTGIKLILGVYGGICVGCIQLCLEVMEKEGVKMP